MRYLLGVILMSIAAVADADEHAFERFGLYVVAADVERSAEFYTKLFQKQPYVRNERFVAFDVAGGLYAVFAESASDLARTRGNSTAPYIRVQDARREFARVAALNVRLLDENVVQEGPITLFRFLDPDGNLIEFFSASLP
jgi:catechol 2,3-dioxygenase-like lactoylglutathione lyase family enzyme